MLKKIYADARNLANEIAIQKAKEALIRSLGKNGIEMDKLLTPLIEQKFEDLARSIINEHGYAKLTTMGLMASFKKKSAPAKD